jgi:demethylmenaquinone methyltransferase/2-methoxy-6-polyprenyl-1,4-benzoquinol methylase
MFDRVARRYDLVNDAMTLGQHRWWRRFAANVTRPHDARVLDLATGTGDLAIDFINAGAQRVVGVDFSAPMLLGAQGKLAAGSLRSSIDLVQGDALHLPFPDQSFDRVSSAFLLRNLSDLRGGLIEMKRVLKVGGWVIALDVTHPGSNPVGPLVAWYFRRLVPVIGGLLSGEWSAYRYLPASLGPLPPADELAEVLREVGFTQVRFHRLGLGSVALHLGQA